MVQPEYKEQIDKWVDDHTEQMLEDLKTLIRIPSVTGEPKSGMPYGEMPAKAVRAMQDMMERYGFRTTNYENYCVAGDLDAAGEKALDILSHLDVVPVSDNWKKTKPFEPLVDGDRIYGRGTSDDKGPSIAALYALRCVRELGLELKRGVRLLCGSDEECGSKDLDYYYSREKEALYTISPDADYPLINIEKGRLMKSFWASGNLDRRTLPGGEPYGGSSSDNAGTDGAPRRGARIRRISVGKAVNIVPGDGVLAITGIPDEVLRQAAGETEKATGGEFTWSAKGDETIIEAKGRVAHGSTPAIGINSATMILELVSRLGIDDDPGAKMLLSLRNLWPHGDVHGKALGIDCSDEEAGELTMSLNILKYEVSEDDLSFSISGTFDCRASLCCDDSNLTQKVRARLEEAGFEMEDGQMIPAHYVSADSELVKKLLESYELYFGRKGEPLSTGGGTYVHNLKGGVAFGCAVPEVDNRMHGDDEFMEISMLVRSAKIIADAIMRLCGA